MVALPEVFKHEQCLMRRQNNQRVSCFLLSTDSTYGMIGFIVLRGGLDANSSEWVRFYVGTTSIGRFTVSVGLRKSYCT